MDEGDFPLDELGHQHIGGSGDRGQAAKDLMAARMGPPGTAQRLAGHDIDDVWKRAILDQEQTCFFKGGGELVMASIEIPSR